MNILFVTCTFRVFGGIDCGAANRSTMFVKSLAKIGHVDVISFGKDSITSNINNCEVVYNQSIPQKYVDTKIERIKGYLRLITQPCNPNAYYVLDKQCEEVVDKQIALKKYDIIACRYIGDAIRCGLDKYPARLVVDVDDNLVSATLRDLKTFKFKHTISKYMYLYKAHAIGWMSKTFLKKIRVSFYSNILEPTSKKSIFLHNVTTLNTQNPDVLPDTPNRLLLVGWLDFAPNKYGALHFVEKVLPKIQEKNPNVELHIVGKTKDEKFKRYLNSRKGVKALGFVDDISDEYTNCRVIIVPVYQGAGTSVKFVEGLMMNRPMVSTPMGARGFETMCHPDKQYLLAKDDDEFVNQVIKLLQNAKFADNIAKNAYEVGEKYFSTKRFEDIVVNSIKKEFQL